MSAEINSEGYDRNTLGSRGYFFLIDTDGSRRSRVNEAQSAEEKKVSRGYFFLIDTDGSRRSRVNEAQSAEEKKITSVFFLLAAFVLR